MFFLEENQSFGEMDYLKVLDYSDTTARIYYVWKYKAGRNAGGEILIFSKKDKKWVYGYWEEHVWAELGNANYFMWPYIR